MDIRKITTVNNLLQQAEKIPPLPAVAKKALRLMNNPDYSMKQLGNTLATDQAIASTLLRWANSSYYGLASKISTVHQAVAYLGENMVRSLVLTAALATYMDRPLPGYYLDKGELWKHSIGVAVTARYITKKYGQDTAEEAYTAGLLCDIGKLAFETALRDARIEDTEWVNRSFLELENDYFGINHAELGAMMAQRWGFPDSLKDAIAFHHKPSDGGDKSVLPSAVHIADILVTSLGIGIGRDGLKYPLDPFALQKLGLDEPAYERIIEHIVIELKNCEESNWFLAAPAPSAPTSRF
jgi:putative nucleotidyltransferase with HDIG domain